MPAPLFPSPLFSPDWPRPSVDVDAVGTSEAAWLEELAEVPSTAWPPRDGSVGRGDRLVVVAPHPDDEALGAGGIVAMSVQAGWTVDIVAVTDGESAFGRPSRRLARRRRGEQERAASRLGDGGPGRLQIHRLGLPDGGVAQQIGRLSSRLSALIAGAAWCIATCPWDGHPDHEATGLAAAIAASDTSTAFAGYPIWAWHWAQPGSLPLRRATRIALAEPIRRRKVHAIDAHGSQLSVPGVGLEPIVPGRVLDHFTRPFEVLFT